MLALAQTGRLGSLGCGITQAEIQAILGSPQLWGPQQSAKQARIWRYGDVEFHFDNWRIWLIFSDHNNLTNGGSSLQLDPWIIRRGMARDELADGLDYQGIQFTITRPQYDVSQRLLQTEAGLVFTFFEPPEETWDESGLVAWSIDAKQFSKSCQ